MTMSNETEVASRLLDFTQEPQAYVSYLDSVVDAFYSSTNAAQVRQQCRKGTAFCSAVMTRHSDADNDVLGKASLLTHFKHLLSVNQAVWLQQAQARAAIEALQAHPDAWGRVDVILQHSKSPQSKFVALQVLLCPLLSCLLWICLVVHPLLVFHAPPEYLGLNRYARIDSGGGRQDQMEHPARRTTGGHPPRALRPDHSSCDQLRGKQEQGVLAQAERGVSPGETAAVLVWYCCNQYCI